jgi:uncharacterized protein (TIGR02266 family)
MRSRPWPANSHFVGRKAKIHGKRIFFIRAFNELDVFHDIDSMSNLALSLDLSLDPTETQITAQERALAERCQRLAKRAQKLPEVAALFAETDRARRGALAARQQALAAGERALQATEQRLQEIETANKRAVALVRAQGPRVPVEAEIERDEDVQLFTGFSGDLAQGGVFVPTVAALELGTQVELQLRLPDRTLKVQGEVRWIRDDRGNMQGGIGVGFLAVAPTDLAFLTALQAEPMFYPD